MLTVEVNVDFGSYIDTSPEFNGEKPERNAGWWYLSIAESDDDCLLYM